MGSWVRTITSPFRKARTILNQQSNSGSIGNDDHRHRAKKQRRQSSSSYSGGTPSSMTTRTGGAGGGDDAVEVIRSSQLYGDVMACAYEDVQVMWSMLDNKSRLCTTTAAAAS